MMPLDKSMSEFNPYQTPTRTQCTHHLIFRFHLNSSKNATSFQQVAKSYHLQVSEPSTSTPTTDSSLLSHSGEFATICSHVFKTLKSLKFFWMEHSPKFRPRLLKPLTTIPSADQVA